MPVPQDVEESKEEAMQRERAEREAEQRTEFEKLQAGRKLLPMFPYRCVCACVVCGAGWGLREGDCCGRLRWV